VIWTPRNPAVSPPQREEDSLAADTANGTDVLFGGFEDASSNFGDTWRWGGTTWTQQHPATSPPARLDAAMATDPRTGNVVLFGGASGLALFGDTWTWNGATWTERHPATDLGVRSGATLATDADTGTVVPLCGASSARSRTRGWSASRSAPPRRETRRPATTSRSCSRE
jgi:hypothetical protein